jgi:putative lipoic acid-binding regulatory protein
MPGVNFDQFKEKLEGSYSWPALYMFKFIVPAGKENEVITLFSNHDVSQKQSKNGKYISITSEIMAGSSDQVISIYEAASKIEGIIAL